jgi:hypothetical protein
MGVNFNKLAGLTGECWLLGKEQVATFDNQIAFPYWFNASRHPGETQSFAWKGQCEDTEAEDFQTKIRECNRYKWA